MGPLIRKKYYANLWNSDALDIPDRYVRLVRSWQKPDYCNNSEQKFAVLQEGIWPGVLDSAAGLKFVAILVYNLSANVEAYTHLDVLLASMYSWKGWHIWIKEHSL